MGLHPDGLPTVAALLQQVAERTQTVATTHPGILVDALTNLPGCAIMLIDREDPVKDPKRSWQHLRDREGWKRPSQVQDEQALYMTTSMETWIAADRQALRAHFAHEPQESEEGSFVGQHFRAQGYLEFTVGRDGTVIWKYIRSQQQKDQLLDQMKLGD